MSETYGVELHRHLDGSLRRATLDELAAAHGVAVPDDLLFFPGMGLDAALSKFAFTLSLLQTPEVVERVASEMCEDAEAEGLEHLEIRFGPHLHQGAPIENIVDAALSGIGGRAGLILCGLYGDPPDLVESLARLGGKRTGVVGIDIAGGPVPNHDYRLADYAEAFSLARRLGLGRTVHAGEGRPPAEIREAIEILHAQRIGHGTTLLDDETVLDLVLARGVTIEACPTSNWQTGVIDSVESHPIARWLDRGVAVTICTDNTLLSDIDMRQEHERVLAIEGMDTQRLARCVAYGRAATFG